MSLQSIETNHDTYGENLTSSTFWANPVLVINPILLNLHLQLLPFHLFFATEYMLFSTAALLYTYSLHCFPTQSSVFTALRQVMNDLFVPKSKITFYLSYLSYLTSQAASDNTAYVLPEKLSPWLLHTHGFPPGSLSLSLCLLGLLFSNSISANTMNVAI